MNTTLKFTRSQICDFQNITTLMFQTRLEVISFTDFYNIGNILQRVQKMNFRSNFDTRTNYTFSLNPNEARTFIELVSVCNELLERTPYYTAFIMDICNTIHRQHLANQHNQNNFNLKATNEQKTIEQ